MASTRLTVSIKEMLTHRLLEHAFTARSRAQVEAECELALTIYDCVMDTMKVRIDNGTGPEKTMREVLALLPAGWPSMQDYFKARIGGKMINFDTYDGMESTYGQNKDLVGLERVREYDKKKLRFPPGFTPNSTLAAYEARDAFAIRAKELRRTREDLLEEIRAARRSTRATLDSVTSIQKLIVIWPEVEPFAAPFMQKETQAAAILPVVARERLNDSLGLPVGAVA